MDGESAEQPLRGFACLEGNEALVAGELATLLPGSNVAATRPGFLVIRDPALDPRIAVAEPVHPAFARAELTLWGRVVYRDIGRAAKWLSHRIGGALEAGGVPPALHVWAQARRLREERFREARELESRLRRTLGGRVRSRIAAAVGDEVIDVVSTGPGEWAYGAHRRTALMSAYPGGLRRLAARPEAPSRGHLKLEEGLEWAELPLARGDVAVDVGCAPGGWSFVLLERGLTVHGVDPVGVAPGVAANPAFTHHRMPVRDFDAASVPGIRWIFCDMNGRPLDALAQLERLIPGCRRVSAVYHTIKLADAPPLELLEEVRARFRAICFTDIRIRHLYHNRQELTLVARRGTEGVGQGRGRLEARQ